MSDNDLIRRGDAINACRASVHRYEAHDAIDALPAVKPPAPDAAADRIEAQAAEIERLRGERDEFEAMAIRAATIAQEQRARAEKGLKRAKILVEAWYRCDDASFRHLMEEMRADVAEAKVDKP